MTDKWFRKDLLRGKTTVITGGAGLIGRELVNGFAQVGSNVVIADINQNQGKAIENELKLTYHDKVVFRKFNIASKKSINSLIDAAISKFGGVDVWVNCAYPRTADWGAGFENISQRSLNKNIEMHLNGYFLCCQAISKHMKEKKTGSIINFGSIYGLVAPRISMYDNTKIRFAAPYPMIKGGIIQLTKYLAVVEARNGVRVNAICPGGVFDRQDPKFVKKYSENTPMGRMAKVKEIVGPTIFLASDAASYITGHILIVDGGWTVW